MIQNEESKIGQNVQKDVKSQGRIQIARLGAPKVSLLGLTV